MNLEPQVRGAFLGTVQGFIRNVESVNRKTLERGIDGIAPFTHGAIKEHPSCHTPLSQQAQGVHQMAIGLPVVVEISSRIDQIPVFAGHLLHHAHLLSSQNSGM